MAAALVDHVVLWRSLGEVDWYQGNERARWRQIDDDARPAVIAAVPVCLTADVDAARARAAEEYVVYGQLPSYRAMLDHEGLGGPEDLALVGDIETIAAGLQAFADAGATTVVANPFGSKEEVAAARSAIAELIS